MAAVIRQHNSVVMRGAWTVQENPPSEKPCNCRDKDRCPLNGVCQIHSIVYKATVVAGEDQRDYTGLTAKTFKRFYSHQQFFWDKKYQSSTALSKHIWSLKDKDTNFEIKWEVRKKATEYQNTTGRCNLCVAEKLAIIRADKKTLLNKRSEVVSKYLHETDLNRYYLCNFPPPISWSLYLTCLSTNMSLNTVSSEPHISFYDHLSSPLFLSVSHHTSLFFPLCFFHGFSLCFISHCSFPLFFFTVFFPAILTPSHTSQHCPTHSHPYLSKVLCRLFCVFAWRSASAVKTFCCKITKVPVKSCKFSQIWSMLLQQPSRSCRLVNRIDFWRCGERPFDVWQMFIPKMMSYHWSKI